MDGYRGIPRDVAWPGNQINDLNEFRDLCYRQCHDANPTDSGWYEKVNECGQQCKYALKAYEYMQGKNPCELRLQAPVYWFQSSHNAPLSESYEPMMTTGQEDPDPPAPPTNTRRSWTSIFYTIVALLVLVILCAYIVSVFR